MKRVRINIIVSFTIMILLMTVATMPVTAYGNSSGVGYYGTGTDPHDWLTLRAIDILGADGYSKISSEVDSYFGNLQDGSYDADWGQGEVGGHPLAAKDHYCDPLTGWGLMGIFQSAHFYAQEYFDKAVALYKGSDREAAYYNLGFAVHVLQDVTIPHHTRIWDTTQKGHEEYEAYINGKRGDINNISGSGLYDGATTASGWVRNNAGMSYGYHTYVNGGPTSGNNNYGFVADILLPIAVRTTAGFLRFFYEEANQGRSETERSGTLSSKGSSYIGYVDVAFGDHTIVLVGNEPGADFNLFVRWDYAPTSSYDASSTSFDSIEKITVRGKGRLYFKVYAWAGSGNWKLAVIYGKANKATTIRNSLNYFWDRTDTFSLKGGQTEGRMIGWAFLAGPDEKDFDLYVRWENAPTTSTYAAIGYSSRSQEICHANSQWYSTPMYPIKGYISDNYLFYVMARSYRGSGSYIVMILIF
ncbi:MAG: zinc dependent phospholipase C family protein [Candidatus Sifarchaeia archaeon]